MSVLERFSVEKHAVRPSIRQSSRASCVQLISLFYEAFFLFVAIFITVPTVYCFSVLEITVLYFMTKTVAVAAASKIARAFIFQQPGFVSGALSVASSTSLRTGLRDKFCCFPNWTNHQTR
jgi:hypothetical protein